MKIIVIGGSGFIGTKLVSDLLAAGHDVTIGDIKDSAVHHNLRVKADIRNVDDLEKLCEGADVIYNLAAEHRDDVRPVSLYHDVNVQGSQNVCDIAEKLGIQHIIFTSTVAVYGFPEGEPDENAPLKPFNPYGETKAQAEDIYKKWQEKDPTTRTLTMVRPTAVFGPGNRGNVYNLMQQIASGKFMMIGKGENRKSLAYLDNVSAFLVHVLRNKSGTHIYNYIDKPDYQMNDLVSDMRAALGKGEGTGPRLPYVLAILIGGCFDILAFITRRNFPISRIRVEKFCANTAFNADKIRESGFMPPKELKQALHDTMVYEFGK